MGGPVWHLGVAIVAIAATAAVPSLNESAQRVAAKMADAVTPGDAPPPLPDVEALMTGDPVAIDASADGTDPALVDAVLPPVVGTASLVPARPFSRAGSSLDRARAQQCLTTAIYYEAASERTDGMRAVAQVVLNRVMHPAFPNTVCDVVFQGSERWTGCQFSFTCDGSMARVPARREWGESAMVAAQALAGGVFAPVGLATHYHTWRVWPRWGKSLVSTTTVGAHIFHRLRGYWGTAVAFRGSYRGGEPMPGPHRRAGPPPESIATALSPNDPSTQPPAGAGAFAAVPVPPTPAPQAAAQAQANIPPPPTATVASARVALADRRPAKAEPSNLPTSTIKSDYAQSGQWKADAPVR